MSSNLRNQAPLTAVYGAPPFTGHLWFNICASVLVCHHLPDLVFFVFLCHGYSDYTGLSMERNPLSAQNQTL